MIYDNNEFLFWLSFFLKKKISLGWRNSSLSAILVPVLLLSLFFERRRKKEGRGELKQREEEEEEEEERERRIQPERLGRRQLFSEAAEKRKCLPCFLLGQREAG